MRQTKWMALLACLLLWPAAALAELQVQEVTAAGMTAWLVEDEHIPAFELRLVFRDAGYASDPADRQGRAALGAALLSEGAGGRDAAAFQRALESKAIRVDASISRDTLTVSLLSLREHREAAFALLADMLLRPMLAEASIGEVKRRFAARQRKLEESPYYLAGRAFRKAAYAGHPYAQDKLGDAQSLEALSREDVMTWLHTRLGKDAAVLSVVGALQPDELAALMREHLDALPREVATDARLKPVGLPKEPLALHVDKTLPQTVLLFVKEGIARDHPDFYAAYVLDHIVGGGSTLITRLGKVLRKERGLTYGVNTSLELDAYAQRWAGALATRHETAAEAKSAVQAVLRETARNGVSAEEVTDAIRHITGSFPLKIDSNSEIASYLTGMQLYALGLDYLAKRNAYFEAVTPEAVNRLAADFIAPGDCHWVSAGPSRPSEGVPPGAQQEQQADQADQPDGSDRGDDAQH